MVAFQLTLAAFLVLGFSIKANADIFAGAR
jgi:hypothetical protein